MKIEIIRKDYQEKQTLGELSIIDNEEIIFKCKTLELPWKNNMSRVSCIPIGDYEVVKRSSTKFKDSFHILDVVDRSYILIHSGSFYKNTLGCILVGSKFLNIDNDGILDLTGSRNTMKKLNKLLSDNFKLKIINE